MKNKIFTLLVAMTTALLFTSCLKDTDDSEKGKTHYDTAIISFKLNKIKLKKDTLNNSGKDTTIISDETTSHYKFIIDHAKGLIYNPDSLPYGAMVDKALASIVSKNFSKVFLINDKDKTEKLFIEKDSIDLSRERTLKVYSQDNSLYRSYLLKVNIHKQDGNKFEWNKGSAVPILKDLTKVKVLANKDKIFVLGNRGNMAYLSTSANQEGASWVQSTKTFSADAPNNAIVMGDSLYILDQGSLYHTTDGTNWKQKNVAGIKKLIAGAANKLFGINNLGNIVVSNDFGATWTVEQIDDNISKIPSSSIAFAVQELATNKGVLRLMIAGKSQNTIASSIWTKLINSSNNQSDIWNLVSADNRYQLPIYENLSLINYDGKILAFGNTNGQLAKTLASVDGGITWKEDTKYILPQGLKPTSQIAVTVDTNHYIWLVSEGQVWKGRLNSLGWKTENTVFE